MLEANPGHDLLFIAHSGYEGAADIGALMTGHWTGATIRVHCWRIPYPEIPRDGDALRDFLFGQWDSMQHHVRALRTAESLHVAPQPEPL